VSGSMKLLPLLYGEVRRKTGRLVSNLSGSPFRLSVNIPVYVAADHPSLLGRFVSAFPANLYQRFTFG
jgi:hypothetical protein